MALLNILHFPDPRLRKMCAEVTVFDSSIAKLVDDMFATMYHANGIGLAAIQVNVHKRVIVTDVSEDKSQAMAFINPKITHKDGREVCKEGCLSVPEIYEEVERAGSVVVVALDKTGKEFEFACDGLQAVCIQHEIDHLNGKLFIDHISPLKRNRITNKIKKQQRLNKRHANAAG